jgi:WD40 repeat protein
VTGVQTCALPIYSQKVQDTEQQLAKAQDNIQRLEQSLRVVTSTAKGGGTDAPLSSTSVKSVQASSPHEEDIVKVVSRISAKLTQSPSPIQSKTARLLWARQAYLMNLQTQGTQWNTIDRSLRDGLHTSPIRLKGTSSKIHTLTFDPSGDHVIAGTSDGKMFLWSMSHPLDTPRIFTGHTAGVLSATVSPNGQHIASGSLDSTIRLWDFSQPTTQPRIFQAHKKGVTSLAFRPDGKELASGSQDHTIRLWDLTSDQPQPATLGTHAGRVNAIAYTPDGKTLLSGGDDLALRIWDLQRTDSPPKMLRGHRQSISTIAIHPFGWMVATGSRDRQIGLWDLRQSLISPTFLTGSEGRISQVQFSTDGTSVASVGSDKSLRIWNWHAPTQPPIQFHGHKGTLKALAISPDGRTIAVGGSGQSVTLWSGTGQLAHAVCDTAKENLPFAEWKQIVGEGVPYERTCPNLPLHPSFLEEGKRLAKQGSREQAQTIFERAKQLDPYLELDPKKEVERLSAKSS